MPRLFVVAGPSGVGKNTVLASVLRQRVQAVVNPSVTTRPPRPGEEDGRNRRFVSEEQFAWMVQDGAFLEHAEYGGYSYGTPAAAVEASLTSGKDVILEIELQGVRQVKAKRPDAVTIFLEPPSWEILEKRLRERGTEDPEALERRLERAKIELASAHEFANRVVNNDIEEAATAILAIMAKANHERTSPPR